MKLLLILALVSLGCSTPPGCGRAISGGLAIEGCFRQVQACRFHTYPDGTIDAYAVSLDSISGGFSSLLKAGFNAVAGWFVAGPAGAAAGGAYGYLDEIIPGRYDRAMCWETWRRLRALPALPPANLEPER